MSDFKQCETCAFGKKGSPGAASESKNRLKGMLCAYGPIPFWCHHTKSGGEYDWKHDPLGPMNIPPSERKLCGGWQRMVSELNARGFFSIGSAEDRPALRFYQKSLADTAIKQLDIFTSCQPEEKKLQGGRLKDVVRATFGKP